MMDRKGEGPGATALAKGHGEILRGGPEREQKQWALKAWDGLEARR